MHRLYQREGAGRPPRVRWALEEVGAPYEYVVLTQEEGRSDEHGARHPLKRVPALEDDTGTLFESAALCLQIADLYPAAGLIAELGTQERGEIYQWTLFAMTELETTVMRAYAERHTDDLDPERIAKADARLAKTAEALAGALDRHDYLVSDRFTIADVVMGGVLHSARRLELMPASPVLLGYLERLDAREAKQRAYDA